MKTTTRFLRAFSASSFAFLLPLTLSAHTEVSDAVSLQEARPPWQENYGNSSETVSSNAGTEMEAAKAREEGLRWLYEKLFTLEAREKEPVEVWRSFQVHLQDTFGSYPDPSMLRQDQLLPLKPVQGKITYIGMFQKKYVYDVFQGPDGAIVMKVKVHLKNPTPEDEIAFTDKVRLAQDLWNEHRIPADFQYRFEFEIVKSAAEAPFSVIIKNSTRGPYDTYWSRDWSPKTVAHELGHMLGLGDEYQPLGKAYGCYIPSVMCSSSKGAPSLHHYYFILRRLMQPAAK